MLQSCGAWPGGAKHAAKARRLAALAAIDDGNGARGGKRG
jgi:hypothetical protein